MPGKTGKRPAPPKPCGKCGLEIPRGSAFMREKKADYHEACWWANRKDKESRGRS